MIIRWLSRGQRLVPGAYVYTWRMGGGAGAGAAIWWANQSGPETRWADASAPAVVWANQSVEA